MNSGFEDAPLPPSPGIFVVDRKETVNLGFQDQIDANLTFKTRHLLFDKVSHNIQSICCLYEVQLVHLGLLALIYGHFTIYISSTFLKWKFYLYMTSFYYLFLVNNIFTLIMTKHLAYWEFIL